jgi:exodeoxyribonuclease-1
VIRPDDALRLNVDLALCNANSEKIMRAIGLGEKLAAVFSGQNYIEPDVVCGEQNQTDPDLAIYSGGFFSENDKKQMVKIRLMRPEQLASANFTFTDKRLPEMLFRYRCRNYPETLAADELLRWTEFCISRLNGRQAGAGILLDDYFIRLQELRCSEQVNIQILNDLEAYARDKIDMTNQPRINAA